MFFRLFTGMAQSYKFSWKKNFFEITSYPVYDHHLSEGYFAQLSCFFFFCLFFFYRGHPRFWNFYSTIPVDFVRVKSYMIASLTLRV